MGSQSVGHDWATNTFRGFSCGSVVKNLPVNAGDLGLTHGSERSAGEENGNPLQHSCLGNPMDRRSLVGYSPWGHKRTGHNLVTKQQQSYYLIYMLLLLAHTRFSLAGYKYPGVKMLRACMVRYLQLINYYCTNGQLFKFLENKT